MYDPRYVTALGAANAQVHVSVQTPGGEGGIPSLALSQSEYGVVWPYGTTSATYHFPKVALYGSLLALAAGSFVLGRASKKRRK